MNKRNVKVTMSTGTAEDFFKRAHEDAKKLDRGEMLAPEIRITFEDPADMLRALTVERVRVLKIVRQKRTTLSSLAATLKRDRKSVCRDVALLESLNLLRTRTETNPGHGVVKVVEPVAQKYHLTATV